MNSDINEYCSILNKLLTSVEKHPEIFTLSETVEIMQTALELQSLITTMKYEEVYNRYKPSS